MSEANSDKTAAAIVESWKPYFVKEYERDRRNAGAQPFDEYWRWAKTFLLAGGSGQKGWMDQVESLVSRIGDGPARQRLRETLYRLGQRIAGEWSKESAYRKVYSTPWQGRPNLIELGRRLQRASGRDRGDGVAIEAELAQLESELEAALRG